MRRKFKGHKYSFNFTNLACELIHALENTSKNCLIKSTRKINFFFILWAYHVFTYFKGWGEKWKVNILDSKAKINHYINRKYIPSKNDIVFRIRQSLIIKSLFSNLCTSKQNKISTYHSYYNHREYVISYCFGITFSLADPRKGAFKSSKEDGSTRR